MKDRTTCIESKLLAGPSVIKTDAKIRVFQRKLYIRAKEEKRIGSYASDPMKIW
jgi:RNA-directed DNA polymerase